AISFTLLRFKLYYHNHKVQVQRVSDFFFQAEDGIRDFHVTGVQTCALPICDAPASTWRRAGSLPDRLIQSSASTAASEAAGAGMVSRRARISTSSSSATCGFCLRKSQAFCLPWPILSPL